MMLLVIKVRDDSSANDELENSIASAQSLIFSSSPSFNLSTS